MYRYQVLLLGLMVVGIETVLRTDISECIAIEEARRHRKAAPPAVLWQTAVLAESGHPKSPSIAAPGVSPEKEKPSGTPTEEDAELAILRRFLEDAKAYPYDPKIKKTGSWPLVEYLEEKEKKGERIRSPQAMPILLEIAETWFRNIKRPDLCLPVYTKCFEAAYYLPGGRQRLLEYIRGYRQHRSLAEAAIKVLTREADPQLLQQMIQWTNIQNLWSDPPDEEDRPITYAIRDFWFVCEAEKELKTQANLRKQFEIIWSTTASVWDSCGGLAWCRKKMRALSERYPKEAAEFLFQKRSLEELVCPPPELPEDIERWERMARAPDYQEAWRYGRRKLAQEYLHPLAQKEYARLEEEDQKRREKPQPPAQPPPKKSKRPLVPDPEGKLRLMGGHGMELAVIDRLVDLYCENYPKVSLEFRPCDSYQVPSRVASGECEIGVVLDGFTTSVWDAHLDDSFPSYKMGFYVVAVLINARNPSKHLTLEQLEKIFSGEVKKWQDVGVSGIEGNIELFSEPCGTTAGVIFQTRVLKGAPFDRELASFKKKPYRQKLNWAEVVEAIAKYEGGIGFCLYTPNLVGFSDKRVRILGICPKAQSAPVFPLPETIGDRSYPILDSCTLVLHPDAPQEIWDFTKFVLGEEGAKILREHGLWPEWELNRVRGKVRLREFLAGKGPEVKMWGLRGREALAKALAQVYVQNKALL
ncbi:MAG: substrate-binding domain-containing protein [Thermoguttaceae bacterium]|nr:substrate-binding domain-containing protein [Thermoguttaceae bacterium]MDW8036783.1 substrate-binding domain-containing protein [Thermoguttaceae bacterium]